MGKQVSGSVVLDYPRAVSGALVHARRISSHLVASRSMVRSMSRYVVKSADGFAQIWPADLLGVKNALKSALHHSHVCDTPVTVAINDAGTTAPFRIFQHGETVWQSDPEDE